MVLHKNGELLYTGVQNVVTNHLVAKVCIHFSYIFIQDYFCSINSNLTISEILIIVLFIFPVAVADHSKIKIK